MHQTAQIHNEEKKDRALSAVLTILIGLAVFLWIYFFQFIQNPEIDKKEEVTTMLINFGTSDQGTGAEEPKISTENASPTSNTLPAVSETPAPALPTRAEKNVTEKVVTGKSVKHTASPESQQKKTSKKASATKPTNTNTGKTASQNRQAAPSAASAVGNLIKGKGTASGSQGTTGNPGNQGDPLGGDSSGESTIGTDRKLVSYIPGTMGRGGQQPNHKCKALGRISIRYTVDAAGNVTSASRSSGISDPCAVSTATSWVRKYVKAERSNRKSSGVYHITF